jgi:hypothetical protein
MDTLGNRVSFTWNKASVPPEDYTLPVLCQTYNGKLLVFKDTMTYLGGKVENKCSHWDHLSEKYNIRYWVYQKELIQE